MVRSQRQHFQQGASDFFFPDHFIQLWLGDSEAFPVQRYNLSPWPGSALGPPSGWMSLEHLHREVTRRHPHQMPKPRGWSVCEHTFPLVSLPLLTLSWSTLWVPHYLLWTVMSFYKRTHWSDWFVGHEFTRVNLLPQSYLFRSRLGVQHDFLLWFTLVTSYPPS